MHCSGFFRFYNGFVGGRSGRAARARCPRHVSPRRADDLNVGHWANGFALQGRGGCWDGEVNGAMPAASGIGLDRGGENAYALRDVDAG